MTVLTIETATSWQSVAVTEQGRTLALVEQDADGSHTRLLMPAIDRALKEAGIGLRDLGGLAVSIGPGSFTGLRVGLATVLGFRSVLEIPVALVPTLEGMAWRRKDCAGLVVPVLKSRKNEVYWAVYEWLPGGGLKPWGAEQVGPLESLAKSLLEAGEVTVYGDGWLAYGSETRCLMGAKAVSVREVDLHRPSALAVAKAAESRFQRQEIAGTGVTPRYVQRTEAEVQFDRRQGQSSSERRRERVAKKLTQPRRYKAGRGGTESASRA
ncbi:MAG: tRNA (adenosine(37)-N6)-threonylcarbamoyltransferase complex dimerization subunit type 1 TsaB [Nitrospiraceae bacterium]